ncbi:hypothetical protein D3C81_2307370 [compost metagenome]
MGFIRVGPDNGSGPVMASRVSFSAWAIEVEASIRASEANRWRMEGSGSVWAVPGQENGTGNASS